MMVGAAEPRSGDSDPRVLVVCGDAEERTQICHLLETEGFETQAVQTESDADSALASDRADLIVLGGRFGDGGSMAVCRRLAVTNAAPIIMISERSDVTERVIALEVGADDLLSRPFNSRELVARARALVRRSRVLLGVAKTKSGGEVRRPDEVSSDTGPQRWSFDPLTRKLTGPLGDHAVLTQSEGGLLLAFLNRAGEPLTHATAFSDEEPMSPVHFRTMVVRIRRKAKAAGFQGDIVLTLRGGGYYMDRAVAIECLQSGSRLGSEASSRSPGDHPALI
jgi:two-component system OmpR family response regulator